MFTSICLITYYHWVYENSTKIYENSKITVDITEKSVIIKLSLWKFVNREGGENLQYSNLIGELAKKKITNVSIARLLNIHSNSVYNKLHGDSSFTVDEAIKIRDTYFPGMDLTELFQKNEPE